LTKSAYIYAWHPSNYFNIYLKDGRLFLSYVSIIDVNFSHLGCKEEEYPIFLVPVPNLLNYWRSCIL